MVLRTSCWRERGRSGDCEGVLQGECTLVGEERLDGLNFLWHFDGISHGRSRDERPFCN